jgi:PAS domain S-box-containing protein
MSHDRLFDLSLDLLCIADFDGRLKLVNPAWTSTLGWTAEELTQRPMIDFIHPDDHAATSAVRVRVYAGESLVRFQNRYRRKDGEYRWFSWSSQADVAAREVFSVARDVTDVRHQEALLLASEERFRLLSRATTDAVWDWSPAKDTLWWSDSFLSVFGYDPATVTPSFALWQSLVHPDDAARVIESIQLVMADTSVTTYTTEYRFRRADGTWADVLDRGHVIRNADGRPVRMIGGMSDLTDRKRLEADMLRAQRLDSIGTLAGGIAHDLNNVFAPMMMAVELLKEEVVTDDGRTMIDTLDTSLQRGAGLVRQVLMFARGAHGQRVVVNPAALVREVATMMQDTFPKSLTIRASVDVDVPMLVGDPTQLHQVLLNLCVNARDAMPAGGTLTLEVTHHAVDETMAAMTPGARPGDYVRVRVTDTGMGILPEARDRLFEPFYTTKKYGEGTGLGLSTTLAIVRSHQGFLTVESERGAGSTFCAYLPASAESVGASVAAGTSAAIPHGHGELILVVDDEESIRHIATEVLQRHGYRVIVARHGAEGAALFARHRTEVAAVITDLAMPVMDGQTLIVALASLDPGVRIIASSGRTAADELPESVAEYVRAFIPKPYTAGALLTTLHDILG